METPVVMSQLFKNRRGETLSLHEIIKRSKTITEVKFSYLSEKKTCIKKIFFIFKKRLLDEKIFHLQDKNIKIYPKDEEVIVAFSSEEEYKRFENYYYDTSVNKSKKNTCINFNNKFQFHFPAKNFKGINWE
jgi:hypothetical protein